MTEHPQEHRQPSRVMEHPQEHSPVGRQAWAADPASPAVPSPQDQALIPLGTEWAMQAFLSCCRLKFWSEK